MDHKSCQALNSFYQTTAGEHAINSLISELESGTYDKSNANATAAVYDLAKAHVSQLIQGAIQKGKFPDDDSYARHIEAASAEARG